MLTGRQSGGPQKAKRGSGKKEKAGQKGMQLHVSAYLELFFFSCIPSLAIMIGPSYPIAVAVAIAIVRGLDIYTGMKTGMEG